jgi:hypothetical protein
MNIRAKQDGHATVASRDSQNWHRAESLEMAAPQLGQLRVPACMRGILAGSSFAFAILSAALICMTLVL